MPEGQDSVYAAGIVGARRVILRPDAEFVRLFVQIDVQHDLLLRFVGNLRIRDRRVGGEAGKLQALFQVVHHRLAHRPWHPTRSGDQLFRHERSDVSALKSVVLPLQLDVTRVGRVIRSAVFDTHHLENLIRGPFGCRHTLFHIVGEIEADDWPRIVEAVLEGRINRHPVIWIRRLLEFKAETDLSLYRIKKGLAQFTKCKKK